MPALSSRCTVFLWGEELTRIISALTCFPGFASRKGSDDACFSHGSPFPYSTRDARLGIQFTERRLNGTARAEERDK